MKFSLERDCWGRLVLIDAAGNRYVDMTLVRAFPLSAPDRCISICDSSGREALFLDSLDGVESHLREIIETELKQREFVPAILRILNTPPETEPSTWSVETDRGAVTFEIEGDDSIHCRDGRRVSIVDSHGIRYEIRDVRKLDAHSRRVLEPYL